MNNKKKLIFLGLDVLVLVITIGVSLAVFNYVKKGESSNKVTIGGITMNFTEGERNISIPVATPASDEEGKVFGLDNIENQKCTNDSENNVQCYTDFTISTNMNIDYSISYEVTLDKEETSTLSNSDVRIYLEKQDSEGNYKEVFTPKEYTPIDSENLAETDELGATNSEMLLDSGEITKSVTYYYRLRMWVKDDYKITQDIKDFSAKINVYGSNIEVNSATGINLTLDGDKINDKTITLQKNALNKKVIAEVLPENAKNKNLIWESSDTNKVKIDSAGNLSLDNIGTSIIRVSTSDKSKSATFTINVVNYNVTGISIPSSVTLVKGNNTTLEAVLTPNDAEETTITWTSSSEGIAVVTNGYIEAVGVGEAIITATTENGYKATCKVIVTPATLNDIEIKSNPYMENPIVDVGNTLQLEVETTSDNLDKTNIIWESSDNEKAIVSSTGKVTGIAPTEEDNPVTITAYIKEYPNIKATKTIEVQYPEIKTITMSSDMTINLGNSTTFSIWISPNQVRNQSAITWESSNQNVAIIPENCNENLTCTITPIADGTTIISATTSDNISASATLTITKSNKVYLKDYIKILWENEGSKTASNLTATTTLFSDSTTDNNIRYMGASPNNYVWFNCNSYGQNCERWRIIGAMNNIKSSANGNNETRVKLVRTPSIGSHSWDNNGGYTWSSSSLKTKLNTAYDFSSNNMVENALWYIRKNYNYTNATASTYYTNERDSSSEMWVGKVAIAYPSDYKFASTLYNSTSYVSSDSVWFPWVDNWLLMIRSSSTSSQAYSTGTLSSSGHGFASVTVNYTVYPTLYLKSNVVVKQDGADGSYDKPYNIALGS